MKKINTILLSLATLIVVGACSRNKDSYDEFDFSGERTVNFTASVASIGDQAATKWQLGDAIGIYAVTAGEPLAPENLYKEKENVKYTTTSTATFGKFVSAKPTDAIQNACLPMDIIAYYPYTAEVKDFQYPIATQNQTALLYANNLKNLRDSKEAHLEFKHKLSMLELTIEAANSDTDLSSLQATKIEGLYTEGSMDLNTGEVLVHENAAMQAISPTVVAEKEKAQVKAILLPNQSLANIQLHLSLDGKEIIWTPENEVDLAGGKIFIYTIQMESDGQFTAVNPEGDIADWVEGNEDNSIDVVNPDPELSENLTIAELKNKFSNATFEKPIFIDQDLKIRGIVMSDDSQGNISNKLYIQDKTAAITLFVKKADLYKSFSVGQEIEVDIQGFYVSVFGDVLQISHAIEENGTWKGQPIEWDSIKDKIEVQGDDLKPITPKSIGFSDLDTDLINTLVRLEGVSFKETGLTYVEGGRDTDRTVVFSDGNEIKLRSKSSAKFANEVLPAGTGSITAFLDYFRGTYQLTIRDLSDVVFEDSDSDGDGSEDPGLETGSVVLLSDDFQITQKSQQLTVYSKNLQESGALKLMPNFSYSKEDSKVKIEVRSAEGGCIWLPAKKVGSLYLNNIPVKDLKELQVKLQMQCLNNDKVNASDLKVYVGEAEVSLAPNDLLTKDYKDFTLNLEKDLFTQDEITVKIIIDNLADGVRIGKLEIVGVK